MWVTILSADSEQSWINSSVSALWRSDMYLHQFVQLPPPTAQLLDWVVLCWSNRIEGRVINPQPTSSFDGDAILMRAYLSPLPPHLSSHPTCCYYCRIDGRRRREGHHRGPWQEVQNRSGRSRGCVVGWMTSNSNYHWGAAASTAGEGGGGGGAAAGIERTRKEWRQERQLSDWQVQQQQQRLAPRKK